MVKIAYRYVKNNSKPECKTLSTDNGFFNQELSCEIMHDKIIFIPFTVDNNGKSIKPTKVYNRYKLYMILPDVEIGEYEYELIEDEFIVYL